MKPGRNLQRVYILVVSCCVVAGLYYLFVTRPLIQNERELDRRLAGAVERLASAGHGMSTEEVTRNIEILQADIEAFAEISRDQARTIRFSPEIEEMLGLPFQRMEFDHKKFLAIDRIRALSREKGVKLFDDWDLQFPSPGAEQPYQLWAQLAVMDQFLRTAIEAGVQSIDRADLLFTGREEATAEIRELEVSVRMQLTGQMEAIHSVIMMLPLNGEELGVLETTRVADPKSSFFLSRFILQKSSAENADEVTLDFVASGFLDAVPGF